ncbi:uncharacterized protein LOC128678044 [Plodia interpunctella]|uniref:uncharacterized protein LOC128678044 n=1 Tax=Plodia interpunctella TaxID=58824 RepID=UPI0023686B18|nr:uncharacterized protein LOC128678044 [Plodia interpunctella]
MIMDHNNLQTCKLISFNCKSVKRSFEAVQSLCEICDIIVLQETWLYDYDIPLLSSIHENFEYTGKSSMDLSTGPLRGRPYGGLAILWRSGVFDSVSVIECNSDRLSAIKVTLADRQILVINVYMPTDEIPNLIEFTQCLSEMSAIVESCDVESVYMLGDFNAHPGESFYSELLNFCAMEQWTCADIERLNSVPNTFTFISDVTGSKRWLDHCVVTEQARDTIADISIMYDVLWSDHFPMIIECNFSVIKPKFVTPYSLHNKAIWGERNIEQIREYYHLCNDSLKDVDYPHELGLCNNRNCNIFEHRVVLDVMYESIVKILTKAAEETHVDCQHIKHKAQMLGWNRHVREAHGLARSKYQIWLWHNQPLTGPIFNDMRATRKIFKSKLKWCQKHQEQIKLDIIAEHRKNKNFKKFWKSTNKLDIRPSLPVTVGDANEPSTIADMFVRHFQVQSPLGLSSKVVDNGTCCDSDQIRFSAKQVDDVIKKMTRGKSPGHDGLSIEHLQHAGLHLNRVLAMFFSLCFGHSYLPDSLIKTIVVPVIKNKTGDVTDKNNYRPISLATIIAKVLDSLMDIELESYLNLHDAQFGFRSNLSTESAILVLKNTAHYYTQRHTPIYACFLDFSRAFDLVSYDILWEKLRERNIPAELLGIFQYWYQNQSNNVRWANQLSVSYGLNCGVRQGGITSPKLFNLYINDLIVGLSNRHIGCRIDDISINNISYADDMVLLSPTVRALRELLGLCEQYARQHGLLYNINKSEFMVFKAAGGRCPVSVPDIKLNGQCLKRVYSFKYLGHIVDDRLRDQADIERERRALAVRCNMLARRFARCSQQVKASLFKAYCQVFYTCSLWANYTQRAISDLRVQYNNGFRMMFGLSRRCSASDMFAQAHTDDFFAIMRKRAASMLKRVRSSTNTILKTISNRYDSPLLMSWVKLCITGRQIVAK